MGPARPPWVPDPCTGLIVLDAQRTVVLTGEERHQGRLRRYLPNPAAAPRPVLVELALTAAAPAARSGSVAVEARLNGGRVGELTERMARRYSPLLREAMQHGPRPGCRGRLVVSRRGLVEVELRLPAVPEGGRPGPSAAGPPLASAVLPSRDRSSRATLAPPAPAQWLHPRSRWRPMVGSVAVFGVLLLLGLGLGGARSADRAGTGLAGGTAPAGRSASPGAGDVALTPPVPTTPAPGDPAELPPGGSAAAGIAPAGRPGTGAPASSAPARQRASTSSASTATPGRTAAQARSGGCHSGYGGCVPIAADVDCAGGGGNGPKFVRGPVRVLGSDEYGLDRDRDGVACEPEPAGRAATRTTTTTTSDEEETSSEACDDENEGCGAADREEDCEQEDCD